MYDYIRNSIDRNGSVYSLDKIDWFLETNETSDPLRFIA